MLIPDEELDALADEFVERQLDDYGIKLVQFIKNPQACIDYVEEKKTQDQANSSRVDEPMKHKRHNRNHQKCDFKKRQKQGVSV